MEIVSEAELFSGGEDRYRTGSGSSASGERMIRDYINQRNSNPHEGFVESPRDPELATWGPFTDDTGSVGKQCPELLELLKDLERSEGS